MNSFKQPEIYYEENANGLTNGLPFMHIEDKKTVPSVLFLGAVFDTDEIVEGTETEETVKEVVLQSYYNSESIKNVLGEEDYNKLKVALGLVK